MIDLQKPLAENLLERDTLSLMRHDRDLSLEERVRIAQELIGAIPMDAIVHGSAVLTHPEPLQVAKEFCRQPEIKQFVWHEFIARACAYWLACATLATKNQGLQTAVMMRELGISLSWWLSENKTALGDELCGKIVAAKPWKLALEGFQHLETTHAPPETSADVDQGYWQAMEFERAAHVARVYGCSTADYRTCAARMANLYQNQRPAYTRAIDEWRRVVDDL